MQELRLLQIRLIPTSKRYRQLTLQYQFLPFQGMQDLLAQLEGFHSQTSSYTTTRMTSEDQMSLWSKPEPQNPYLRDNELQRKSTRPWT